MVRSGRDRRVVSIALGSALLLAVVRPAGSAAEWRLFGVEGVSGHLALRSDGYVEEASGVRTDRQSLEQQARLRLSSYVLHPRFLYLTADSAVAFRAGTAAEAGWRNLDSGLTVDFLREHPLTFGLGGRTRAEDLERDYKPYERRTTGGEAHASFRSAWVNTTLKCEVSEVKGEEIVGNVRTVLEDKLSRFLLLDSSFRAPSFDTLSLRYQFVETDERRSGAQDSRYHLADLTGSRSVLADRGRVNAGLTAWRGQTVAEEQRLTLRENWTMDWTPTLHSTQEAEISQRNVGGAEFQTYRAGVGVSRELSRAWSASGNLAATHSLSTDNENWVYRLSGGFAYRGSWRGYRVGAQDTLSLTRTIAGPERSFLVDGERHSLPLNGSVPGFWERLNASNVELSTVRVWKPDRTAEWTRFCEFKREGAFTWLRWVPQPDDPEYPALDPSAQLLEVVVDYTSILPDTDYAELSNLFSLHLAREFLPGAGIESNLNLNATVPGTAGRGLSGLDLAAARCELGMQGYLRRPAYEVSGGIATSRERNSLFVRGSTKWRDWSLSESYRAEFFPDLVGHTLETRAGRVWGISEKTHVAVELVDQMYSANGELKQGLTSLKARTARLFNPFMRVEVEGRAELNRVVRDSTKLALDAKYVWQQGQLDLVAGYEFRVRTYDRFTSHRLYATVIRRL